MKINPKQKYKFVDKDLVNGFVVLTGKELRDYLNSEVKSNGN